MRTKIPASRARECPDALPPNDAHNAENPGTHAPGSPNRGGLTWFALLVLALPVGAQTPSVATVGMSGTLADVVIPGPELEPKPIAGRADPIVVRVVRVHPHGTAKRYTLEWYGLAPGDYDLRDSLRRVDGQPLTAEVPNLPVHVDPVLPPGQVQPNALPLTPVPAIGGYWTIVRVALVLWVLGLAALIASMIPRRKSRPAAVARSQSLADRLRPLVEGAVAGTLSAGELAALERSLYSLWRKRLRLETLPPEQALARMRADAEAGPLLNQLERWLHHPASGDSIDVANLLEPYRRISARELPAEPGVASV